MTDRTDRRLRPAVIGPLPPPTRSPETMPHGLAGVAFCRIRITRADFRSPGFASALRAGFRAGQVWC
jgi:hypothetical protein